MSARLLSILFLSCSLALLGCGDDGTPPLGDSGTGSDSSVASDSTTPPADSATPPGDSATPPGDSATPPGDASADTATPPGDASADTSTTGDGGGSGVGAACGGDEDCDSGLTCLMELGSGGFGVTFPDGYCTVEGCGEMGGPACPSGSACYSAGFGTFSASYCGKTCSDPSECRMGYECSMPALGMVSENICNPSVTGFP